MRPPICPCDGQCVDRLCLHSATRWRRNRVVSPYSPFKTAGLLETYVVEVRIVIRFWSVKGVAPVRIRRQMEHVCLGEWCGYGALLHLKPGRVFTTSGIRDSRARSLQMPVCIVQIALSERTYALSLLASP
jgi:hypothetical protein